ETYPPDMFIGHRDETRGECGRDSDGSESSVSGWEETSGAVPAVGARHRARVADGLPERTCVETLALQTVACTPKSTCARPWAISLPDPPPGAWRWSPTA